MIEVRFHVTARLEMVESARFYEQQQSDLGRRFLNAVETTIDHIRRFPDSCPNITGGISRARVRNFPYGIVYRRSHNVIQIIAVMHLHREPGYWEDRL